MGCCKRWMPSFLWISHNSSKSDVQAQDETGAINMLFGAAAAGVRVLASTSGPGWSLMQEGMSNAVGINLRARMEPYAGRYVQCCGS